jgi:hypothetical protein
MTNENKFKLVDSFNGGTISHHDSYKSAQKALEDRSREWKSYMGSNCATIVPENAKWVRNDQAHLEYWDW